MAFQFRRGTDAERQSITPKAGEPIFVTDTGRVYVGTGTTQGGIQISAAVVDDGTPSLGGNLNLNDYDIVGTGNINIDGTITASGSINLGDGVEDNVIVGGVIASNLIPDTDNTYDLGSDLSSWKTGFFDNVTATNINVEDMIPNRIQKTDSSLLFDSLSDTLYTENIVIQNIWKEDSSVLYDGLNDSLRTNNITATTLSGLVGEDILNLQTREYYGNIISRDGTEAFNYDFKRFTGSFSGNIVGNVISNNYINANEIRSVTFDTIKFQHAMRFPNLTDEDKDALPQEPGLVFYNSTTGKFQGYVEDTGDSTPGWIDLH